MYGMQRPPVNTMSPRHSSPAGSTPQHMGSPHHSMSPGSAGKQRYLEFLQMTYT